MRSFAVVPAAGRSERMGQPKLLLPWRGRTVIEHVLVAWQAGGVERTVVVLHRDDEELAGIAQRMGAEVVAPAVPPPEMKASVRAALAHLESHFGPAPEDAWLLAPADMPTLNHEVIRQLIASANNHPGAILVPTFNGRRGHPVLFRWPMAAEVHCLNDSEGVNALLARHPVAEIPVAEPAVLRDLDTPEDYARLQRDE
jgi:molybdenum cofactor cytidylyltransferase